MYKKLIFLVLLMGLFSGCQSLREGLEGNKKSKSAEEFLIEKKTPLSIPPDFEKLPVPKAEQNQQETPDEIQTLLTKTEIKSSKSNEEKKSTNLDELILDKIKR